MASLGKRVDKLEEVITDHLRESGEIRSDLKWLKKFMWFVLSSPIVIEILKHVHTAGK